MRRRAIGVAVAGALLLTAGGAGSAAAQLQLPMRRAIEVDLHGGYTAVQIEKWSNVPRADESDRGGRGLTARLMLWPMRTGQVGVEIGNERLFGYELHSQGGATIVRSIHTVNAPHVALLARLAGRGWLTFDFGGGLFFFDAYTLPSGFFGMNYPLLRTARFSMPVGFRLTPIIHERTIAMTLALRTGISLRRGDAPEP